MKKVTSIFVLMLCLSAVTYAQKWELGIDAGLVSPEYFYTISSNKGGSFTFDNTTAVWDINSSFSRHSAYKVGLFAKRNISGFFIQSGLAIKFNEQYNVAVTDVTQSDPSNPRSGESYSNSYALSFVSVPLYAGVHLFSGFGLKAGVNLEFNTSGLGRLDYPTNPEEVNYMFSRIGESFSKTIWQYSAGVFYHYKRVELDVSLSKDLSYPVHDIRYNLAKDYSAVNHASAFLWLKRTEFTFTLRYSIFNK